MPWWPQNRPQIAANPPCTDRWPFCLYSSVRVRRPLQPRDAVQLQRPGRHRQSVPARRLHELHAPERAVQARVDGAGPAPPPRRMGALADPGHVEPAGPDRVPDAQLSAAAARLGVRPFEDLLYTITLSPWMGNYLDMVRNDGSPAAQARGVVPNENYARELLQLFSIGLWELRPRRDAAARCAGQPDSDLRSGRHRPAVARADRLGLSAAAGADARVQSGHQLHRHHDGDRGAAQRHRHDELSRCRRQVA